MTSSRQIKNPMLGEIIRTRREAEGLSQRQAAKAAGIDVHTFSMLERGKYESPSPLTLKGVSEALDIPLLDLFYTAGYITPYDVLKLAATTGKVIPIPQGLPTDLNAHYTAQLVKTYGVEAPEPVVEPTDDATFVEAPGGPFTTFAEVAEDFHIEDFEGPPTPEPDPASID